MRWISRKTNAERASVMARELDILPVLAGLLIARGCETDAEAAAFLSPSPSHLHEPMLMKGMREATARTLRAIDRGERILIYGDYDVDGTTGTVLLRRALALLGAKTGYHVPHRFTEGYGINRPSLERARREGYGVIVSVDCGIRSHEPLEWARANGVDVIVTDHHLPDEGEGSPPAFAILNPNQQGCEYPDKNLAGVGVAFKLAHALLRERGRESVVNGFLKIAAIGTVADVAQLTGENRAIVSLGLADLPNARNPGLRALMEVSGCGNGRGVSSTDLGFRIGPRINAAGRMDAARAVVELFEAADPAEARALAEHLDSRNRERQEVQQEIIARAVEEMGTLSSEQYVAVIAGEGWHRGVIGIAASKIAERIHRPCVVISLDGDDGHGSARSIDGYHLLEGITSCADLLVKFGGHKQAAGLQIARDRIPELRRRLNEHARAALTEDDLAPSLQIEAELPQEEITLELAAEVSRLEPFGAGNPRPVFLLPSMKLVADPFILKDRHLKLRVAGHDGYSVEAVWWDGAEQGRALGLRQGERIDIACSLERNVWRDEARLQLTVRDARIPCAGSHALAS